MANFHFVPLFVCAAWLSANAQLCKLNSEFNQTQTLQQAGWLNINESEGWNAEQLEAVDINQTEPGHLAMMPYSCAWYGDLRGPFLFKEVTGDFIFTTQVRVTGRGDNDPPHSPFSLAGCMVRRPKTITHGNTDWGAGQENYVFLSFGFGDAGMCVDNNPADGISCGGANPTHLEVKATKNSSSNLQITPIGVQAITLRIAKIGNQVITMYQVSGQPFQVRRRYTIGAGGDVIFDNDVQVGLVTYTDWQKVSKYNNSLQNRRFHNRTVLNAASNNIPGNPDTNTPLNPDVVARFDYARFNEIPQSLAGMDLSSLSDAELITVGRLGFPSQASNCNICPPNSGTPNVFVAPASISEKAVEAKSMDMGNGIIATPLLLSDGKLKLVTWSVSQDGVVKKEKSSTAEGGRLANNLDAVKLSEKRLVTALQLARGPVKLMAWDINDAGNIKLAGTVNSNAASNLSLCPLTKNRFVTTAKNAAGKLELTTWEIGSQGSINKLGTVTGESINDVTATDAGNSKIITAVKTSNNRLKLIAWNINASGIVTQLLASGTQPEAIGKIAVCKAADGMFVTAATELPSNRLKLISWELSGNQLVRRGEIQGERTENFTLHTQPVLSGGGAIIYAGTQSAPSSAKVVLWCILADDFAFRNPASMAPPPSAVSDWGNFQFVHSTFLPEKKVLLGTIRDNQGRMRFITWRE